MGVLRKFFVPILLVIGNILVKSIFLVNEDISHDEPFTIYHAQFDIPELINYLKNYNNPPLFEIILHFWIKLFGMSVTSVRILPMLFSSFSVFFIYQIGKEFFNQRVALIASLLFTFSTMQIWYAHDCRVYSLFLLLTVISFYLFFKMLNEGQLSFTNLFFLFVSNVLIMYAHYFGLFVWLIEGIIILIFHLKQKKILINFSILIIVSLLVYSPQIFILSERFFDSAQNGTWLKPPDGIESVYNMIWSFSNAPVVAVLSIIVLVSALVKFLFFSDRKMNDVFIKYLIIWFALPFTFMFFVSYKIPMFLDRYLIFVTPAFYLLIALSLQFLFKKDKFRFWAMLLIVFAFGFSAEFRAGKKRHIKETVDFINSRNDEKTLVLICPSEFNTSFAYHYNSGYFQKTSAKSEYGVIDSLLKAERIYFVNAVDSSLINRMEQYNRIIYLDAGADFAVPGNSIKSELSGRYKQIEEKFFQELFNVYVYSTH